MLDLDKDRRLVFVELILPAQTWTVDNEFHSDIGGRCSGDIVIDEFDNVSQGFNVTAVTNRDRSLVLIGFGYRATAAHHVELSSKASALVENGCLIGFVAAL
jgi:hypothetical protein